jgi:hypothetical protein
MTETKSDQMKSLQEKNRELSRQLCRQEVEQLITQNTDNIKDNKELIMSMLDGRGALESPSQTISLRRSNLRNAGMMAGGGGVIALFIKIMEIILKGLG